MGQRHSDKWFREYGYVMFWWQRGEFDEQRQDWQAEASFEQPGSDLLQDASSTQAMLEAPLGEPKSDFDVRCVYDSRVVNGYDFNYSAAMNQPSGASWTATFVVPNGYRAVPRKWSVNFDSPPVGPSKNSTATIQQGGAALPNNGPIIIGMGTDDPIETFFLCEENTTFGITGANSNAVTGLAVIVNVYGNLIPVTDVALPLAVSNQRQVGTGQVGIS